MNGVCKKCGSHNVMKSTTLDNGDRWVNCRNCGYALHILGDD